MEIDKHIFSAPKENNMKITPLEEIINSRLQADAQKIAELEDCNETIALRFKDMKSSYNRVLNALENRNIEINSMRDDLKSIEEANKSIAQALIEQVKETMDENKEVERLMNKVKTLKTE